MRAIRRLVPPRPLAPGSAYAGIRAPSASVSGSVGAPAATVSTSAAARAALSSIPGSRALAFTAGARSIIVRSLAKIAVVNVPYNSHTEAAIRLTRVLVRQGHEVVSWGHTRHRVQIEAAGARFEPHEPEMPEVTDFMSYVASISAIADQVSGQLVEQLFAHAPDLLVHDSLVLWARVAGDYLGIPRLVSHPMFPLGEAHRVKPGGEVLPPPPDQRAATARFEASRMRVTRRWGVQIERDEAIHSAAPIIVAFTTEELVGASGLSPAWRFVGPLMTPPPAARSRARPLIYVCFGTSYNKRGDLYRKVIQALADDPVDVLVSTGGGFVTAADVDPLPANVTLREFVPARDVLAQASVHVTHGGCNSVHETLLAGVPMVCIPQAFDQFGLGGRIHLLGAGVLARERQEEIGQAVRLLLDTEKARARARELGEHLAGYDGDRRVAEAIEQALTGASALAA
jgi:MGT family glycosyltransferase